MKRVVRLGLWMAVAIMGIGFTVSLSAADGGLTQQQVDELMLELDQKTQFISDFKAIVYMQQKHREKGDLVYQSVVYRRDENDRFMMLFLKPKADAGKGYLMLDKNLFLYSPATGDWSRVSEDRIGGTDTKLNDFDAWKLATKYSARYVGSDQLGKIPVYHLTLEKRPDQQVDTPKLDLWVQTDTHHVLKEQDFALNGKLLRTTYRTKWQPVKDAEKRERFIPMETRVFDEVEKGNQTTMVIDTITLDPLPDNIFSKAWLESKSR